MQDTNEIAIAHVTVEVRRPDRWRRFFTDLADDRARVDQDDAARTGALRLTEGPRDDLVRLGLAYAGDAALDAAIRRLSAAGRALEEVDVPGARRAVRTHDPAGTELELLVPTPADPDDRWPIGHVALAHPDPATLEAFYVDVLGFRCNERLDGRAGPIALRGSFLGSARRHHALAVIGVPSRRRLHHVCFGLPDVGLVAERRYRARAAGVPLTMDLGRHTLPDGTTSFYAASPSGFDIELGAGGNVLDGAALPAPVQGTSPSAWGHDVTLRAKARFVSALVLGGLGLG